MATSATAGTAAGRPQPQTTVALESPGGPFIRYSENGRMPQYTKTGLAFGNQITTPLVARPGYYSSFRLRFSATTGVGASTSAVAVEPDAPFSTVGLLQFKDAFGTVIFAGTGYAILYLVPLFSGSFGTFKNADVTKLPSYSAIPTGATSKGDFSFSTSLPLEFARGMGVIAGANASLPPSLNIQTNPSSAVYSTAPATVPKINVQVDSDFYWLPEGVTIEPPGLGTTRQWIVTPMNPPVGSKFSGRVQGPRLGGFLDTIIVIMRNSAGARIDGWPGFATTALTTPTARFQVILDGVPVWTTTIDELLDDMAITWPTVTRPKGVVALSRRTAMNQSVLGLLTSGEQWLASSPGTLLELAGYPWGAFGSAPAQLSLCLGQIVPAGTIIQGAQDLGI